MTGAPVSIALSGCGTVGELYYAPALARLSRAGLARVVACFDPDPERRRQAARWFPEARSCAEFDALFHASPGLLIVAAPPREHPRQALAALRRGCHVLCEKPLALSAADARGMVAAAAAARCRLFAGMVRRRLPAARLVRDAIASGVLGDLIVFDVFEGGPFDWPVESAAYFEPSLGGVGVLDDVGSHVLDLLCWWLGEPEVLASADDAMGGVAANALVSLRCGGAVGTVRLSRDWRRPNHVTVCGTKGSARFRLEHSDRIELELSGGARTEQGAKAARARSFFECFEAQLEEVLAAARGEPAEVVDAADVLPSIAALEAARRASTLLPLPWLSAQELFAAQRMRSR